MHAVKGAYHDGIVKLLEKPDLSDASEVLIIFPDPDRSNIVALGGVFKEALKNIDTDALDRELDILNRRESGHLLKECRE